MESLPLTASQVDDVLGLRVGNAGDLRVIDELDWILWAMDQLRVGRGWMWALTAHYCSGQMDEDDRNARLSVNSSAEAKHIHAAIFRKADILVIRLPSCRGTC